MVRRIAAALDAWERDAAITRVVIRGAGDKAFCAGGDIRHLYDLGRAGDHAQQLTFWREEYQLNRRDQDLSQTGCRTHRRHCDGWGCRRLDKRVASRRRRTLRIRHARSRHRLVSRRWRNILSAAARPPCGRLFCADWATRPGGRRDCVRACGRLRPELLLCRVWPRRWKTRRPWRRRSTVLPRQRRRRR